jgi:peptide/nickel transport system ATP-binding protein
MGMRAEPLLEIRGLKTHFPLDEGLVRAVDGVDLTIRAGQTVGLAGESGCGKSVTAFSVLQIVGKPGRIVEGQVLLRRSRAADSRSSVDEVVDLAAMDPRGDEIRAIRGADVAMIFQEPMSSLSVMHTVGFQIQEAIQLHQKVSDREARQQILDLLARVGIPRPEDWIDRYPFQLSGGMRQRVMIAMALSCNPKLLIADEPTTALDVTTQAQILELIKGLQKKYGMAMLLITHDLGVIAETCDEVAIMYMGEIVEQAPVDAIFFDALHPYTRALLHSIPVLGEAKSAKLRSIEGSVPDPYNRPPGCPFHPRCERHMPGRCDRIHPTTVILEDGRSVRCLLYDHTGEAARV